MQPWLTYAAIGLLAFVALIVVLSAFSALFPPDEPREQMTPRAALQLPTATPPAPSPTAIPAMPTPTTIPTPIPPAATKLTKRIRADVNGVLDVKVKYSDADTISIMLVVDKGTTLVNARKKGDEATSLVKEMVEGSGELIGLSRWEYIVLIYEPRETEPLAVGQKRRNGGSLDWDVWPIPSSAEAIPTDPKDMAVSSIVASPGVLDAAVTQDGESYSLVIIVDYATNEAYARQLGDNFVRMVKALGPDDPPGKQIGRGDYDYVVGVYYPNEKQLVLGAKSRAADRISW